MAIVNGCCCWRNLRSGSFAAGFYILILYTIVLTAGLFQHFFNPEEGSNAPIKRTFAFTLVMIIFSIGCIIASILLLIGLCVDSRMLLIPWLICVFSATVLDGIGAIYVVIEGEFSNQLLALLAFDIFILGLNIYSVLCVYAQYQEYCQGRGFPQLNQNRQIPPMELNNERAILSRNAKLIHESATTNSSSVSVGQSSAFVVLSDATSNEESTTQIKDNNFSNNKENSNQINQYPELENAKSIL